MMQIKLKWIKGFDIKFAASPTKDYHVIYRFGKRPVVYLERHSSKGSRTETVAYDTKKLEQGKLL